MSPYRMAQPAFMAWRILFRSRSRGKRLLSGLLTGTLACGIFALILILSIMNGLQSDYINAIVEVSSYHLRIEGTVLDDDRLETLRRDTNVVSVMPFYETQTVMAGRNGRFYGYLLRAVPPEWKEIDPGMASQIREVRGRFDFGQPDTVAVSRTTALRMGLLVGDKINLISLSASGFSLVSPPVKTFTVGGIYETAFREIDELLILTGTGSWSNGFSVNPLIYGIKLKNRFADDRTTAALRPYLPADAVVKSWRDSHRSFFSALKLEKFAMSFLLGLVAAVVILNLYFMIKRLIFEKQKEIAVFKAIGVSPRQIRLSFLFVGILMGIRAVFWGTVTGLFVTIHFSELISLIEILFYSAPVTASLMPDLRFFYDLPIRIDFKEVTAIACFSLAASAAAAYAATARLTEIKPCEVMRYE